MKPRRNVLYLILAIVIIIALIIFMFLKRKTVIGDWTAELTDGYNTVTADFTFRKDGTGIQNWYKENGTRYRSETFTYKLLDKERMIITEEDKEPEEWYYAFKDNKHFGIVDKYGFTIAFKRK